MKFNSILILGGLGFIGSRLAHKFLLENCSVQIIDGLLPNTGGSLKNVEQDLAKLKIYQTPVEDCANLGAIIAESDIIIDAMGYTSHIGAMNKPMDDLRLNLVSHLSVMKEMSKYPDKKIIYLGSKCQYGKSQSASILENDRLMPEDVQGINKLAAESYYRVYSKTFQYHVISLRIPNCFGINQPYSGGDVGLIGGFIRAALRQEDIVVFGENRQRSILYVDDLAAIIYKMAQTEFSGFEPVNINGLTISIKSLAELIVKYAGGGRVITKALVKEIENIDMGDTPLSEINLIKKLGQLNYTPLDTALTNTITYFRNLI